MNISLSFSHLSSPKCPGRKLHQSTGQINNSPITEIKLSHSQEMKKITETFTDMIIKAPKKENAPLSSPYSHSLEAIKSNAIKDDQILSEYKQLQRESSKFECNPMGYAKNSSYNSIEGCRSENRSKNRYRDITPYDESIILTSYNTYFNGSLVKFSENSPSYITTQAPLPQTFDDFWDVVFHSNSNTIVMLTKMIENKSVKAHCYWPSEVEDREEFSSIVVELIELVNDSPLLNIRKLKITKDEDSRIITHYHYLDWNDNGVADIENLNNLLTKVGSSESFSPTIVHCSAGVGRAGTYIAIDSLRHDIQKGLKDINVFKKVEQLRAKRRGCVQKSEQYALIFKTLSHHLSARDDC